MSPRIRLISSFIALGCGVAAVIVVALLAKTVLG